MKHFVIRLLNVLVILLIINAALVFLVPPDSNNYLATYSDKLAMIDTLKQPRIILLGGSNLAFGVDSKMMADSLGCNVANMGLHAGCGMRLVMCDVLPYIQTGDIVVLQIEYGNFFSGGNGEPETLALLMMATHWRGLKGMSAAQQLNVGRGMPQAAYTNLKRLIKYPLNRTLDTPSSNTRFVYARSGFNQHGDEVNHWTFSSQERRVDAPSDIKSVDESFVCWLKQAIAAYQQAGAVVVMVPPVSPLSNFRAHYAPAIARALQAIGHPYVTTPQSMTVPDSLSFDGGYHVTRAGVTINTLRLIRLIRLTSPPLISPP